MNDQKTTQETEVEENRLIAERRGKLDALREAQLHLLNHPKEVLNNESFRGDKRVRAPQNTEASNRLSPQFWAAFSLSGDWQ